MVSAMMKRKNGAADLMCYEEEAADCGGGDDTGDGDGDGDGGAAEICEEGYCPEGTYWDGGSCYDCCYCLTEDDDSACSAPSFKY